MDYNDYFTKLSFCGQIDLVYFKNPGNMIIILYYDAKNEWTYRLSRQDLGVTTIINILPNCTQNRNHHAKFEIDRTILSFLNKLTKRAVHYGRSCR